MPITAITAAVSVGSGIANTVSGIKDTNKRREVEAALQRLSYDDQRKLNEKMAKASNQTERLSILIAEVNKYNVEKIKEQGRKDTRNAIIIIGGSIVFLVAMVLVTRKK